MLSDFITLRAFSSTATNEEKINLTFDRANNSTDTIQHIINKK